jgi:hypothetical protein
MQKQSLFFKFTIHNYLRFCFAVLLFNASLVEWANALLEHQQRMLLGIQATLDLISVVACPEGSIFYIVRPILLLFAPFLQWFMPDMCKFASQISESCLQHFFF